MRVHTPHEFARVAKQQRQRLGWTQSELATRIGVTRQWVIALERGSPRLELGLTLRAMTTLGVGVDLAPPPAQAENTGIPTLERESRGPASRLRHGTRADPAILSAPSSPDNAATRVRPAKRSARVPEILTVRAPGVADPEVIVRAHRNAVAPRSQPASGHDPTREPPSRPRSRQP